MIFGYNGTMFQNAGRRMALLVLAGTVASLSVARGEVLTRRITADEGGGATVVLRARDFTPGDIVLLTLEGVSGLREADVTFRDREYRLEARRFGGNPLAFIGIDYGLKAGTYPLRVLFIDGNGWKRAVEGSIEVRPRQFRLRRLVLDEKFVTAPPEELDRIRLEREMVAAVYRDPSPDWLGDGLFELPHAGLMYPNFGDRRLYNGRPGQSHSGVDITAEMGDPILASNAGRVVLAEDLYFSGNTVIIDHGLGVFTSYFHMSRLLVRTGEVIAKGRIVGEAGSTGRSTGPHLHWGVSVFGSRVDPRALLRLPLLDWEKPARAEPPAVTKSRTADPMKDRLASGTRVEARRQEARIATKAKAVKAARTPAPAKGHFYVQLAAFDDRPAAERFASRTRAAGFATFVLDPPSMDKKALYRVRVGGYPTRAEAEKVVPRLRGVAAGRKFEY